MQQPMPQQSQAVVRLINIQKVSQTRIVLVIVRDGSGRANPAMAHIHFGNDFGPLQAADLVSESASELIVRVFTFSKVI